MYTTHLFKHPYFEYSNRKSVAFACFFCLFIWHPSIFGPLSSWIAANAPVNVSRGALQTMVPHSIPTSIEHAHCYDHSYVICCVWYLCPHKTCNLSSCRGPKNPAQDPAKTAANKRIRHKCCSRDTQTYMPFVQAHLLGFGLRCRQGLVQNNGSATGTSKESHTINRRALLRHSLTSENISQKQNAFLTPTGRLLLSRLS
jgi:hypothetical protein